jgi:hypothetical protein
MENQRDGNKSVRVIDPKTGYVSEYSMSIRLKRNLDEKVIPDLHKKDSDCFLTIDGEEGGGKSWLAFQIAKYVDPSFNLSRVVFSAEDFRDAILKAKKGQCVVFDEAFTGLSSRASLSMINKVLISLTMQMRQKNLFIIIVLPSFFLLDKYIALFRSRALIHVYKSKGRRGYFILYNKKLKKYLYLVGQKTYSYHHKTVRSNFRGRFYGKFALGDEKVEKLYRKKKLKALEQTELNPMSAGQAKYKTQRDVLLWRLRKELKMTYQEMENYLNEYDIIMNYSQVRNICVKFGDRAEEIKDKAIKNKEKLDKSSENEDISSKSELIKAKELEDKEFDEEFEENQVENEEIDDSSEDFD